MVKVFLDAGHGGKDPGASGNGLKEKDIALPVTLKVGEILKRHNVEVYYSRTTDVFIELSERAKKANNIGADIFVSIHCNAATNILARGVETFSYPRSNKGTVLSKCIQDSLVSSKIFTSNRGIKTANFAVLRETSMTAALTELGFISNVEDSKILKTKQNELAIAVAKGILNYLGIKYVPNQDQDLETGKAIYYETVDGLKVIETTPKNVYVAPLPGKTLREFGIWGINGTWQNNADVTNPRSIWGLATNGGKPIGPNSYQNSPKGYKRGTIIFYKDGSLEVKRINNINEITKPFEWAIGGGMLLPSYDPILEGFTAENKADDVLRRTSHTGIGFKGNKVYLIVHNLCTMLEFKNMISKLNLDGAIFLDGGGSTQMNYKGKGIHSSRKLSHGVFIKEG